MQSFVRIFGALRDAGLVDDRKLRLSAVYYARQTLALAGSSDPSAIAACDTGERYAEGRATAEEMADANCAAWDAALGAESEASGIAGFAAAGAAVRDALIGADAARDAFLHVAKATGVETDDVDISGLVEIITNNRRTP